MRHSVVTVIFGLVYLFLLLQCNFIETKTNEDDIKYKLTIIENEDVFLESETSKVIELLTRDGQKHKCYLPLTQEEEKNTKDLEVATIGKAEEYLNKVIQDVKSQYGQCFTALINSQWWIYELCLDQQVRQYHVDNNVVTAEYILGHKPTLSASKLKSSDPLPSFSTPNKKDVPYFPVIYNEGTTCDLTTLKRTIELRFFCLDKTKNFIEDLREPSTCNYILNVNLSGLCNYPIFLQKEPNVKNVICKIIP